MVSDEQLVQAMAKGDQAAFEAFVYRYHGPLLGYLERTLHDSERAEDFVQEVFVRLLRQLQENRIPERVKPWLYRVAINLCRDYWRSSGFRSEHLSDTDFSEQRDQGPSVVEIYERQETRKEILASLNELSDVQRQIVILRFYQELKLQEIGEILNLPLGTVKSSLFYALKKLKEQFTDKQNRLAGESEESKHV